MSVLKKIAATCAALLLTAGVQAQKTPNTPAVPALKTPNYPVERYTLDNGLRVVFSEDHSLPLVAISIGYDVGSRNEVKGKTGFAHLFEHMMFQGSAHMKRGEIFKRIADMGGDLDGATRDEITTYAEVVSSEKLPTILWMEADRMRSLAVNAANLQNQKDVVKEEKRMRLDNVPYSEAELKIRELAYSNFSNAHMPIGSMADLDAAPLEYVQYFFNTYYIPNNAVLVVAGDFVPKTARALIDKLFGVIPRKPDPPKTDVTENKAAKGKTVTLTDERAPQPLMFITWPAPSGDSPDLPAMLVLDQLLFSSKENRASRDIGAGEQIAAFGGGIDPQRGPALLELETQFRPDIKPETLIDQMYVQILRVQSEPPEKSELERVKANYLAGEYRANVEPLMSRVIEIARWTTRTNHPEDAFKIYDRILAVTPEQVQAAAKKYLTRDVMNVVIVKQKEGGQ